MHRRTITLAATLALVVGTVTAGSVAAAGPVVRVSDSYTETFFDDFIWDLCGIETYTTATERWTYTEFADGSSIFHNVRTFVPDDPRIPVEKGAGTKLTAPDGSWTVLGSPALLFEPGGHGVRLISAGKAVFSDSGELVLTRGQADYLTADMAELYCP